MVEMTLGEIRSLISKFNDIFFRLRKWEAAAVFFKVYGGEDPEEFRPAYDYERIQKEMAEVNGIIRHFKSMVAKIKSNGYFDNNMSIDEMTMLKEDLEEKVRRLKRILNDISENDTPSDGRSEEDCRNYDSNAIRMDYENAKKELEDISDYLDDSSEYTVFRLEDEDEVDWEKIIRDKNAYLDFAIDKELWKDFRDSLYNYFNGLQVSLPSYNPVEMAESSSQNPWGLMRWWAYL